MLVLAHAGSLMGAWLAPRGIHFLLGLNAVVALAVLIYTATRARYIIASVDWPYLGLIAFKIVALSGAIWAFRDNRFATICSYIVFGLHALASVAAVIFAFAFKLNKLM